MGFPGRRTAGWNRYRANCGLGTSRSLVERIGRHARLCWSTAVAQEEDYDKRAIRGIRRIINVRCLDYATALDECQA